MQSKVDRHIARQWIIVAGLASFFIIMWFLSISKTVRLYNKNQEYAYLADPGSSSMESDIQLSQAIRVIDERLISPGEIDVEGQFLKLLGDLSTENNIMIKGIGAPEDYSSNSVSSKIYEIKLNGEYKGLLKVVQGLEQDLSCGNMISMLFELKNNRNKKLIYLEAVLTIQIVNVNHELSVML
jgi:hypothetical protein